MVSYPLASPLHADVSMDDSVLIELTTDILVNTIKKGETTGANLDKYFSHESLVHYQILYTIMIV